MRRKRKRKKKKESGLQRGVNVHAYTAYVKRFFRTIVTSCWCTYKDRTASHWAMGVVCGGQIDASQNGGSRACNNEKKNTPCVTVCQILDFF